MPKWTGYVILAALLAAGAGLWRIANALDSLSANASRFQVVRSDSLYAWVFDAQMHRVRRVPIDTGPSAIERLRAFGTRDTVTR